MRGGDVFMNSLRLHGVDTIFGNPGTTENSVLDRLIDQENLRYIVALHESIAVCAASFYAQASGKTPVVNLHVAPGLGNGIGMIYGALKANSPMVVTAGQQDTRMRLRNPVLAHDLVAMAAPVTKFSAEPNSADELGPLLQRAFKIANERPRGPVFIGLPVNVMEQETSVSATKHGVWQAPVASVDSLAAAADLILTSTKPCIISGDDPARDGAFDEVLALSETIGAPVFHEGLRAQLSFPNQHPNYRGRVPFESALTAKLLAGYDLIILLGGPFFEDIWFDTVSALPAGAKILQIENNEQQLAFNYRVDVGIVGDLKHAIGAIVQRLGDANDGPSAAASARQLALREGAATLAEQAQASLKKCWDDKPMAPLRALHEIARALEPGTVVVDESITSYGEVAKQFDFRTAGEYFSGRGGGIGQGIAGAIGTQLALPDKRVVALSGDGSAMYSIQALWSAAHHDLPIVFIMLSNREYRVLKHNLDTYRRRFDIQSDKPYPHMDLRSPQLDFVSMGKGMGLTGECVSEANEIAPAVSRALAANAPRVLEIVIAGKP